jgi:hypothetical protein
MNIGKRSTVLLHATYVVYLVTFARNRHTKYLFVLALSMNWFCSAKHTDTSSEQRCMKSNERAVQFAELVYSKVRWMQFEAFY